jgi:hypothetical protein
MHHGVAGGVAEGVIDQVEAIDADECDGERNLVGHEPLELFTYLRPVRRARERITIGRVVELVLVRLLVSHVTARHQDAADIRIVKEVVGY